MLVITLTNCPSAPRGDLTKWLQEISTGVYVGQVSTRVREELWQRIQQNVKSGRVTMVYSANNEQRMDFRVHNAEWEPIDFDGLKLMLRPSGARAVKHSALPAGFSRAAKMHRARKMVSANSKTKTHATKYAVVDVETTGLSALEHEIIEIAAIIVNDEKVESTLHTLVKCKSGIPPVIQSLTGITNDMLAQEGLTLPEALQTFLKFVGNLPIISHNTKFDYSFLRAACEQCDLPLFSNQSIDTLSLARRLVNNISNYKLSTLLTHFDIEIDGAHRGANDCLATKKLYEKLIELQ